MTLDGATRRPTVIAAAVTVLVFATLSQWTAWSSEGFLEADGCVHYIYARHAFAQPHYFVDIWGRPFKTALCSVPAWLGGLQGVRLTSLLVALATALLAWRIAADLGVRRPVMALIFTLGQPLLFLHSASELTELPFALLLALAFLAYQRRAWWGVALAAGWMPTARPEGFGFVLLALAALLLHRRARWWPVLLLPLVLWHWIGWELYGRPGQPWTWLRDHWPYSGRSVYGAGPALQFLGLLPAVIGPFIFPATVLGTFAALRGATRWAAWRDHAARCALLAALLPVSVLVVHSALFATGRLASSGEARYLLIVAPLWGVLAAMGWEHVVATLRLRWPLAIAGAAAAAAIPLHAVYPVLPLAMSKDWREAGRAAAWYVESGAARSHPGVAASHPGVFYYLDISPTDPRVLEWHQGVLARPTTPTVLFWHRIYGTHNADADRVVAAGDLERWGWRGVDVPGLDPAEWRVFTWSAR